MLIGIEPPASKSNLEGKMRSACSTMNCLLLAAALSCVTSGCRRPAASGTKALSAADTSAIMTAVIDDVLQDVSAEVRKRFLDPRSGHDPTVHWDSASLGRFARTLGATVAPLDSVLVCQGGAPGGCRMDRNTIVVALHAPSFVAGSARMTIEGWSGSESPGHGFETWGYDYELRRDQNGRWKIRRITALST